MANEKKSNDANVDEKKDEKDSGEISDDQLEQVSGGASDYLLEIDGVKGESKAMPTESISFNYTKITRTR